MQVADKNRDRRGTLVLAIVCAVLQLALAPNICLLYTSPSPRDS